MEKKNKFDIFIKYEDRLPGVKVGLDFLRYLNLIKNDIKTSSEESAVSYYDYQFNSVFMYDQTEINNLVQSQYDSEFLTRRRLIYNKLYMNLYNIYETHFEKYNFKYSNQGFINKNVISKFIQGLRFSHNREQNLFDLYNVLGYLHVQFFDNSVTEDQQSKFLMNYVLLLQSYSILEFFPKDFTIKFADTYFFDLKLLMNLSFDMFGFGKSFSYKPIDIASCITEYNINKIAAKLNSFSEEQQLHLNDGLTQYVISSVTDKVFIDSGANNLLYDFYILEKNVDIL